MPPSTLTRAQLWQRNNPMFISGLNVVTPTPTTAQVEDYFTDFHATALHTWATGFPTQVADWVSARAPAPVPYVTWFDRDGTVPGGHGFMGGLTTPPAGRIGYQIGDEPLDVPSFQSMAAGANAVHLADPNALLIVNFASGASSFATVSSDTASFAPFDVVSMDDYNYKKNAYKALGRLREVAIARNKVWWRYLDSFFELGNVDPATEADLRWDAYVGAAYGYTGHTWFIYQFEGMNTLRTLFFTTTGDFASAPTQHFTWAAAINQELAHLGRALVMLRSTDVRYVSTLAFFLPAETTAWAVGAGNDPYLAGIAPQGALAPDALVGHFRDDCDEPYALVMTVAHPTSDFPNQTAADQIIRLSFDFAASADPSLDKTAILVLDPVSGAVAPRALTSTGVNTATVDLTLRAGSGVLFKYKTAKPFALR